MGSTIQVGLGVSTHLAPAAAASSAMNLQWTELSLRKGQELETQRFEPRPRRPAGRVRRSHPASPVKQGQRPGKTFCILPSANLSLGGTQTHKVTPVKAPGVRWARRGSEDGCGKSCWREAELCTDLTLQG